MSLGKRLGRRLLRRWGDDLARRYVAAIDRQRKTVLVAALIVAGVGAVMASRMPVYGDFSHLLPPSTPSVRSLRAIEARAQLFGTVLVAIEGDDPKHRLRAAEIVRDRISSLGPDVIAQITYDDGPFRRFGWKHRYLFAPLDELQAVRDALRRARAEANPLFVSLDSSSDDRSVAQRLKEIRAKFDEAQSKSDTPSPLVSPDGKLQIIIVRTRFEAGNVSRNRPAVDRVEAAVAEARAATNGSVKVGLTGDVVVTAAEHRALLGGMLGATLFTVVVVGLSLLLFFRSARAVGALLLSLAVGALAAFGFARLAIGHLNMATAFLVSIVVGNGINSGLVLLARHLEERRRGLQGREALVAALRATWLGTLVAAVTASVAYVSLVTTDFLGFRHFGVIGAVGILLCWLSAFTVLPAILLALEHRQRLVVRPPPRLGLLLAHAVPQRPAHVLAVFLICTVGAGYFAFRYISSNPFETDFKNLRSSGAVIREANAWNEKIDAAFGRGISGGMVMATPSQEQARALAERLRAFDKDRAPKERLFTRVASIDDFLPADQDEKRALLAQIRRLMDDKALSLLEAEDRQMAETLRPPETIPALAAGDIPEELSWLFTERDGTRGRIVVATVGGGFDLWKTHDLARFVTAFERLKIGPEIVVGGLAFVQHDIIESMQRGGIRATIVAALGAVLVVLLSLGMNRFAFATLIAGLSGTLLLLASAHFVGLKVNFLDFVALPITIGIGIEYAVNIAARERKDGVGGARRSVATTGAAVTMCAFTTIVGYGSLLFSANQGIRSFGIAAFIGEITCLVSALALVPALLEWRRRYDEAPPQTESLSQSHG